MFVLCTEIGTGKYGTKGVQEVLLHSQTRAKTKLIMLVYFFADIMAPFPKDSVLNPMSVFFGGGEATHVSPLRATMSSPKLPEGPKMSEEP